MFNNYHISIAVFAISTVVNVVLTLTGNFPVWTTVFYLLSPLCFAVMGIWFYQERQLRLLGKALDSFISAKAAQSELSPKKYN